MSKFACDAMLGRLARWLRLSGHDTYYSREAQDDELLELCKREKRTLMTRDRSLYSRALKMGIKAFLIEKNSIDLQLAQLIKVGIKIRKEPSEALCPLCGSELVEASPEQAEKLPPSIRESKRIYTCTKCGKLYWHGSHWRNIKDRVEKIEKGIQNSI